MMAAPYDLWAWDEPWSVIWHGWYTREEPGGGPIEAELEAPMITINPPSDPIDIGPITITPPGPIEIGPPSGDVRDQAVAIVNRYETYFAANRDDYRAGRISKTEAQARFDQLWNAMVTELRKLGAEGERAIRDRQPGGKFDWWAWYRPDGSTAPGTPPGTQPPGLPPIIPTQPWWVYVLVGAVGVWLLSKLL